MKRSQIIVEINVRHVKTFWYYFTYAVYFFKIKRWIKYHTKVFGTKPILKTYLNDKLDRVSTLNDAVL